MLLQSYSAVQMVVLNGFRTCRHCASVWLGVCLLLLPHARSEDSSARSPAHESLVPGTVLAAVTIHHASDALARWNQTASKQLGSASELMAQEFQRNHSGISARLRADVGISLEEFQQLQLGQLTFATVRIPDQPLSVVLLASFQQQDLMDRIVDRFDQALRSSRFHPVQNAEEFFALRVYERERPFRQMAVCVHQKVLCLSTNPAVVRAMLQQWDSGTATGFSAPAYQAIVRNCHAADCRPLMTWYLDPVGLLTEATYDQEPKGSGSLPQLVLGLLPRLGLDGLHAVGGTLDLDVHDRATLAKVQIVLEQSTSGLLDLVRLQPDQLTPSPHVLAHAPAWVSTHWDVSRFFSGGNQVLAILEGEGAFNEYFHRFRLLKGRPTFKENLLDQMTGRLVYSVPERAGQQQWVLNLQMRDPQDAAARLSAGNEPEAIQPLAETVPDQHSQPIYKQRHFGSDVYLTVNGDSLLMSGNPVALQRQVAESHKVPSASDRYQRVASLFPETCLLQAFHRSDPMLRNIYEALRLNGSLQDKWGMNFSALPAFDQIQPSPGPTAVWAVENEAGIQLTYVSLYADQKHLKPQNRTQDPNIASDPAQ